MKKTNKHKSRYNCVCFRRCIGITLVLLVLYVVVVGVVIFKSGLANNTVVVNDVVLELNVDKDLDGLTFAQLSDIHFQGYRSSNGASVEMINDAIDTINNAQVDFVLLTGDFVDLFPEQIENLTHQHLSKIKSRYGTIAVLGNHDYQYNHSKGFVVKALQDSGIRVLINEVIYPLQLNGSNNRLVEIIGIGDFWSPDYDPQHAMQFIHHRSSMEDQKIFRIILSHNPDTIVDLKHFKPHLILSGHTHGGQYCLPPLIREIIPFVSRLPYILRSLVPSSHLLQVVKNWQWTKGLNTIEPSAGEANHQSVKDQPVPIYAYTNTGLSRNPFRLWCRAEVTLFHVQVSQTK